MPDLLNQLSSSFAVTSVLSDQKITVMQKPDVLSRSPAVNRKPVIKRWTYGTFYTLITRCRERRCLNKMQLLQMGS